MSRTEVLTAQERWLRDRGTGIGGSDAPVVLGQSDYKTPYRLWAEKCGLIEADDLSDKEWIEWGHRLEQPIADALADRTGREIRLWAQYQIVRHEERPWQLCTPDATEWDQARKPDPLAGLLQIKTTGAYNAREWDDEPPLRYQIQLQHELAVTGATWGTLAVLIGGQRLKWFDAERNDHFIAALTEAEAAFWTLVQSETPPPVDYRAPSTGAVLAKLHPTDSGEAIVLPDEAAEWDRELARIAADIKVLEARETELKNRIKDALGPATFGLLPTGGRWSWKTQTTKAYTVDEKTHRILRRLK